jgi:hypothetical protein
MVWFLSDAGGGPQPAFDQALDLLKQGLGALDTAAGRRPRSPTVQTPLGDTGPSNEAASPGPR